MVERRIISALPELRAEDSGDITGYAAVFYRASDPGTEYRIDGFTERIARGAFDDSIGSDDVVGLFNHNPDNLLGRTSAGTLSLSVDSRGLRYSLRAGNGMMAQVRDMIARGDLRGSSFGFQVLERGEQFDEIDGELVRTIKRAKLFDVGPVTFPAYAATSAEARAAFMRWAHTRLQRGKRLREQRLSAYDLSS